MKWKQCFTKGIFIGMAILFILAIARSHIICERRAAESQQSKYKYVKGLDYKVGILRGNYLLVGTLDEIGTLKLEKKYRTDASISGGAPLSIPLNGYATKDWKAYEYRAGKLIPGVMRKDGVFVPTVGEKIIKFDDYSYSKDSIPIWNLPGRFVLDESK